MNKLVEMYHKIKLFFYLFFRISYLFIIKLTRSSKNNIVYIWNRPKRYLDPNMINCMFEIQAKAKEEWTKQWPKEYLKIRSGQLTAMDFPDKEPKTLKKKDLKRIAKMTEFVKNNRKLEDRANNMEIIKKINQISTKKRNKL